VQHQPSKREAAEEIELREIRTASPKEETTNEDRGSGSASPGTPGSGRRQSTPLIKQKSLDEEEMEDVAEADAGGPEQVALLTVKSPPPPLSPPKISLLAPFDPTPRSRSQSVELPELRITTMAAMTTPAPGISLLTRPQTPLMKRRGSRDERLALLLRQRSLTGAAATCVAGVTPVVSKEEAASTWVGVKLGSPTLKRDPVGIFHQAQAGKVSVSHFHAHPHLRNLSKPQSLDLPTSAAVTPAITVTFMDSGVNVPQDHLQPPPPPPSGGGMQYLSPLTIPVTTGHPHCGGSRTTSESNLSSSGYSSMASPGKEQRVRDAPHLIPPNFRAKSKWQLESPLHLRK